MVGFLSAIFFLILVLSWLLSILKKSKLEVNSKGVKAKVLIRSTAVHWCVVFFHRKKGNRSDFCCCSVFIRGQFRTSCHQRYHIALGEGGGFLFATLLNETTDLVQFILFSLTWMTGSCPPCHVHLFLLVEGQGQGQGKSHHFVNSRWERSPPCQPPMRKARTRRTLACAAPSCRENAVCPDATNAWFSSKIQVLVN